MTTKLIDGPWHWKGEDYRAGWGWQMLVGPNGEGIIVGAGRDGGPSPLICGFSPLKPEHCRTGLAAEGTVHAVSVHVFSEEVARLIEAAPDLLAACRRAEARFAAMDSKWQENVETLQALRATIEKATKLRLTSRRS